MYQLNSQANCEDAAGNPAGRLRFLVTCFKVNMTLKHSFQAVPYGHSFLVAAQLLISGILHKSISSIAAIPKGGFPLTHARQDFPKPGTSMLASI